jgi:mutual gliding-motility protein MglA
VDPRANPLCDNELSALPQSVCLSEGNRVPDADSMPSLNDVKREVNCKIVYYGPGLSGKTTNLQFIHGQLDPSTRGDLVSMPTQTDRTLFFDLLPVDLATINGWNIRLAIYTVPGQVEYNASRQLILKGADAIVFIADSDAARSADNIESRRNLVENLATYKMNLAELPFVLQYNKRDLRTAMSIERMEAELNTSNVPSFESIALEGPGVLATLREVSKVLYARLSSLVSRY